MCGNHAVTDYRVNTRTSLIQFTGEQRRVHLTEPNVVKVYPSITYYITSIFNISSHFYVGFLEGIPAISMPALPSASADDSSLTASQVEDIQLKFTGQYQYRSVLFKTSQILILWHFGVRSVNLMWAQM